MNELEDNIHCSKMCKKLLCVATTIGKLKHSKYLKPAFLDTANRQFSQRQSHVQI